MTMRPLRFCHLTTFYPPHNFGGDGVGIQRLCRALVRRGHEVAMAVDGAQALAAARSEAPALVLMDMSLPVIDGWEATRRLKADPALRDIPVIALTAHAMSGDRERALEAGCDDFDTKPIEFERLLAKIDALIHR